MIKYIAKRLGLLVFTLFLVITLTFFMMQVMPGTPFQNPKLSPEQLERLIHAYGLDKPLWQQYLLYLKNIFTLDFGTSFIYQGQPVSTMIFHRLPVSARLGLQALLLGSSLGILLGRIAAKFKNKALDTMIGLISLLGISVPSFVVATLILYYVGFSSKWLPVAGWGTFAHTIMPTLALSFTPMAIVTRFIRSEMIESLNSDYIQLARAKGLSMKEVINKHVMRNSLLPLLTLIGPMAAGLLTGSVFIESIFNIPGIGSQFVSSIPAKDFPVIMSTTIIYAALLMSFILITDIITALVDPRVKH